MNLFDFSVVYKDFWAILEFVPITLELTAVAMVSGLVLGFIIALVRIRKIPVLNQLAGLFISMIRGTPILVQLYITYFGIPIALKYINYYYGTKLEIANVPPIVFAMVALSLNQAAYNSVTIRSALEAVNRGEMDAASSIGMTGTQRMFRIMIPEVVVLALPSLGNSIISLVKGTSLAFSCTVVEMTAKAKILGGANYRYFEAYIALAIIYWLITIVMERLIDAIVRLVQVPEQVPGEGDSGLWWRLTGRNRRKKPTAESADAEWKKAENDEVRI